MYYMVESSCKFLHIFSITEGRQEHGLIRLNTELDLESIPYKGESYETQSDEEDRSVSRTTVFVDCHEKFRKITSDNHEGYS